MIKEASASVNTLIPSDINESVIYSIIGSDYGLSPVQHQDITWTNADLLAIENPRNKIQWKLNKYQTGIWGKCI